MWKGVLLFMLSALNYFSLATKLTAFLENVCAVSDIFWGENSPNRDWDTAEKIQISSRKVPIVIKGAKF